MNTQVIPRSTQVATPFRHEPPKVLTGELQTVSGAKYNFDAVLLYNAKSIAAAEAWKMAAMKNAQGFSSGLGFIGNFGAVLTAGAVLGFLENTISSSRMTESQKQFAYYYQLCINIRSTGQFIPLNRIVNIRVPSPSMWQAVDLDSSGTPSNGWMFYEDPFVALRLSDGSVTSIFWSTVERYDIKESSG